MSGDEVTSPICIFRTAVPGILPVTRLPFAGLCRGWVVRSLSPHNLYFTTYRTYIKYLKASIILPTVGRGGSFTARVISTYDDGCQTSVSA